MCGQVSHLLKKEKEVLRTVSTTEPGAIENVAL